MYREVRVTFKLPEDAHVDIRTICTYGTPDSAILAMASREFFDRYGFEPIKFTEGYAIDGLRDVRDFRSAA